MGSIHGVTRLVTMPFTGVGHAMVLNQSSTDFRQEIRSVQSLAIGHKIDRAKHRTLFAANASIELLGVFKQLDADATRREAFLGGVGHDAGFRINKGEF